LRFEALALSSSLSVDFGGFSIYAASEWPKFWKSNHAVLLIIAQLFPASRMAVLFGFWTQAKASIVAVARGYSSGRAL
jgi:hypothetical protein